MSNLQIFNFNNNSIRTVEIDGNAWFVAKDVSECLGYENPQQAVRLHCKKSKSLKDIKVLSGSTLHPQTVLIPESDVYHLTMRSTLESAIAFQDLVCEEIIPSIRKTGSYTAPSTSSLPPMPEAAQAAIIFADYLRLSESGKLSLLDTVNVRYGSPMVLPSYAVDAPPSEMLIGSSMPVSSATELLKEHDAGISAIAFNRLLESQGFIETLTRKSSGTKPKRYKSVTKKGLEFGKNDTDKNNPKETQPHWYIHKFAELLDLILHEPAAA